MTNVPASQPVTPVEPVTRAQMLRAIADAVESGLPAPMSFHLHLHDTGTRHVNLRMDDNRADEVAEWMRAVAPDGDAEAVLSDVFEGSPCNWRSYKYGGIGKGASWHGWTFEVWSAIDEPQGGDQ